MKQIVKKQLDKKYYLKYVIVFFMLMGFVGTSFNAYSKNYFIDKSIFKETNFSVVDFERKVSDFNNDFFVIAHGRPGAILINSKWLSGENLSNWLYEQSQGKNVRIYSCDFAKGNEGSVALKNLKKVLGVNISASNNLTGKDGDWILEEGQRFEGLQLNSFNSNLQTCGGVKGGMLDVDDFDGDGICNNLDYDDDNDGIPDTLEINVNGTSCDNTTNFLPIVGKSCNNSGTNPNTGNPNYVLTQTELGRITDYDTTTLYQATYGGLPFVNRLTFTFQASTVSKIRIYNYTTTANAQLQDSTRRCVRRINDLKLLNALNQVVYTSGVIYPITVVAGKTYYEISFATPLEGINSIELNDLYASSAGWGMRDIEIIGCPQDYDNDGFANKFDTDSDNDGCPDAAESNAVSASLGYTFNQLTGSWMVNLPVGTNSSLNTVTIYELVEVGNEKLSTFLLQINM